MTKNQADHHNHAHCHNHTHDHDHDHHHHESVLDHLDHQHGQEFSLVGETQAALSEVWAALTQNEKLKFWFPELTFENEIKAGAYLLVKGKGNQILERNLITDVEAPTYLSFMWGVFGSNVAIELENIGDGMTQVRFTQWVYDLNDQVAVDIATWHVALQQLGSLLEGTETIDRQAAIDAVLPQIKEMLAQSVQADSHHHH
ncbi:SRPBCC domain-containing protein [Eremococcus coleocola]|uniref:Activator of Hsp90 ATPase homologue 1/2-like C-terminal domain-containing protein n=1 Tax=Eremococcus coleocola ACS-139-V-Col8 TaxID=908337 RepID=E4KQ80_9LACT|nr:SRPBCC domain-containing protein [Eremococcus coleocola]EFR30918.1 hypothetical protein HMPREF9257_1680 [Eremococcus coleocola ACS-139-V-Col8]